MAVEIESMSPPGMDGPIIWRGQVAHLHRAPRTSLPMHEFDALELVAGSGIVGDRYRSGEGFYSHLPEPGRQITFFEIETLEALERDHAIVLTPAEHRRNVTTRGVPLNHLVGRRFRIGSVCFEGTRLSFPCRHIEEVTGKQILQALTHRSGLNAIILTDGTIRRGDGILPA